MKKKTAIGILLALLLASVAMLAFNIQSAKASGTIYIRADGSVEGTDKIISSDNVTYTFTDNIYDEIVVERSNTVIDGAGYRLAGGFYPSKGMHLSGISNVTIKNTNIEYFDYGIFLNSTSHSIVSGNNITKNHIGIELNCSSNNYVSGNIITDIWDIGIELSSFSSNNLICGNIVANNTQAYGGVILRESSANNLYQNNITNNWLNGISLYHSSNNSIDENNIQNNDIGIYLQNSTNNNISGNVIRDNNSGVVFQSSSNNTVSENRIANNGDGINICNSSFNNITGNNIICHVHQYTYAIRLGGSENTVYGNNITNSFCGIKFENYERVPVPYGYKYVVVCYNNIISGNNITNNEWGIGGGDGMGVYSYNNTFSRNTIANNRNVGISLYHAENNKLWGNIIANNGGAGVGITHGERASNNIFYHNNFMNNTPQVSVYGDPNSWDDGHPSGGNYWSDYTGVDLRWGAGQNETGSDGIGDTTHEIDADNIDRYPLMAPFSTFDAGTWNGEAYNVDIVSNSTLSDFKLNVTQKTLGFNVTGVEEKAGFCRVTVPNVIVEDLWQGNFTVLLNGETWPFRNWTDNTNTYIYINYTHSEHQIVIVPEFPSAIILPLFMVLSIVAVVFAKKKTYKKQKPKPKTPFFPHYSVSLLIFQFDLLLT